MPKFNPFRPGHVIAPGMFCGRINEIQNIERGLFQTKNSNPFHFLIEGERGIGKTSLMLYFDWVARGKIPVNEIHFNFIVVNIELRSGMSQEDIINAILEALRREMSTREALKNLCKNAWDFLSNFEVAGIKYNKSEDKSCVVKLDELTHTLLGIDTDAGDEIDGILILIDEADSSDSTGRLGELCKLLTERLTRKGCDRLCIGLAGLPGLVTNIKASHESAARIFSIMPLEPLELFERKQVIASGLKNAEEKNGFNIKITDEASNLLAGLSEGYPHFLQEFCFYAFNEDIDNSIDSDDVLQGAFSENGAIDQLGQKYYSELYNDQIGSEDYRIVLNCMAEESDGWVSRQHLIEKSGVKMTIVDNALRVLKDRGIILVNPKERGLYKLPTKSFAIWIKVKESGKVANKLVQLPTGS